MVGRVGRWIPGKAPPDDGYWEALLQDGETGNAAPPAPHWLLEHGPEADLAPQSDRCDGSSSDDLSWQQAFQAMEQGHTLKLLVTGCNRGGLMVMWNGIRGFVPASHLTRLPPFAGELERQEMLRSLIGESLSLNILELDPEQGRFVLSEKATHLEELHRQDMLDHLIPGDIRRGRVTSVCPFGVFVDLGGLEGLIHISELSWGRVDDPGEVLQLADDVEVYVLNVDHERGRVGLSLKRLQPDPWLMADKRYNIGQVVEGAITHGVEFGAFLEVEEGLEGLIHVSELSYGKIDHPQDAVSEGDVVKARVLNVDTERRRIGLSLKDV